MKDRIYGTEVEFGVSPIDFLKSDDVAVELIFKHLPLGPAMNNFTSGRHNFSVFLENEARFYFDTGMHPEYATPETRRPRDSVRWEKAGERIIEDMLSDVNNAFGGRLWRNTAGVTFIKNNCNPFGSLSWGWHQNFLVERECNLAFLIKMLTPFLVTSYIWDGNGRAYIAGDGGFKFFLSQRASVMTNFFGQHTSVERSMISSRDEPHADYKWRRLHIAAKDSHMSELVIYLDMALIGLIIEMCEERFLSQDGDLLGVPPGEAKCSIEREYFEMLGGLNQDLTLNRVFRLDGRHFRALDIQRKYFDVMKKYEKVAGLDYDTKDALDRFGALLIKLEKASAEGEPEHMLIYECDWAAKYVCIRSDAESHAYSLDTGINSEIEITKGNRSFKTKARDRIQMLDLNFHDVRRDKGLHYILEKHGKRSRILDDEEINFAKRNPPQDTRAAWRGWWRRIIDERNFRIVQWDWTGISANPSGDSARTPSQAIRLLNLDPFEGRPWSGKKLF